MTFEAGIEELKCILRQTGFPVCFMDFETDPEDTDEDGRAYPPCIAIVADTESPIFADSEPVLLNDSITIELYLSNTIFGFRETRLLERLLREKGYTWGNKKRTYLRDEKVWMITYQLSDVFEMEE